MNWYFQIKAQHCKLPLRSGMFDLGLDSLRMIIPAVADSIRFVISSEFYYSYSDSPNDPILKGYGWMRIQATDRLWIPDEVDTLLLEFFCELRPGVYERLPMRETVSSDLLEDTVIVDTTLLKPRKREVMIKMVRHETDVWFPF